MNPAHSLPSRFISSSRRAVFCAAHFHCNPHDKPRQMLETSRSDIREIESVSISDISGLALASNTLPPLAARTRSTIMASDNERSQDLIDLGAASTETHGGGPMPIDEALGFPEAGLGDD